MLKIATWNVNSIKARLGLVLDWLRENAPDVLLLQEIKCETGAFPCLDFESMGYRAAVCGQKAYHGVAVLSKRPIEVILTRLPGEEEDEQARYLEVSISNLRMAALYLPNGNPVESEKFAYKLRWMERLRRRAQDLLSQGIPFVLGGDFNVIPEPEDVYDPKAWEGDALYRPESRAAFRTLLHLGLTDAFRALHPKTPRAYTFWDYQAGRWMRDEGLRIDHFLLSPQAADRLEACAIDTRPRALDKASDHTPVVLDLRE